MRCEKCSSSDACLTTGIALRFVITAIKNRTKETITIPHQQRGPVEIEPGEILQGPFVYTYDPDKEGAIPSPNEVWFVDFPTRVQVGDPSSSRTLTARRPNTNTLSIFGERCSHREKERSDVLERLGASVPPLVGWRGLGNVVLRRAGESEG